MLQALQLQPVWDKRYFLQELGHHFSEESADTVQTAMTAMTPYSFYQLTDGPFRNCCVRFGYDPSKDPSSWIYQYVEFRFSKRPQKKESDKYSEDPLPLLYGIELNLHNRYPLYILRVGYTVLLEW